MTSDNHARLRVLITVLTAPALAQHAFFWIPAVVVGSFAISPPLAWFIAPMMMQRFIKARQVRGTLTFIGRPSA